MASWDRLLQEAFFTPGRLTDPSDIFLSFLPLPGPEEPLIRPLPLRLAPLSLLLDIACWAHMARQAPQRLAGVLVGMAPWTQDPQGEPGWVIPRCRGVSRVSHGRRG